MEFDRRWLVGGGAALAIFFGWRALRGGSTVDADPAGYVATTMPVYGGAVSIPTTATPNETQPAASPLADLVSIENIRADVDKMQIKSADTRTRVTAARSAGNTVLANAFKLFSPRMGGAQSLSADSRVYVPGAGTTRVLSTVKARLTEIAPKVVTRTGGGGPAINFAPITIKNKSKSGLF